MSWFELAATPDGRRFYVAAYRTLTGTPAGVSRAGLERVGLPWPLGHALNRLILRGRYTVRVGPWGGMGRAWSVSAANSVAGERVAARLYGLISNGSWDPATSPIPNLDE